MVKKIVLIIFTIALIAGAFAQSVYLDGLCQKFIQLLEDMEHSLELGDLNTLSMKYEEFSLCFEDARPTLASLLQHSDLDTLGMELATLHMAIVQKDTDEIALLLERVSYGVLIISGNESTWIENIL